MGVAWLTRSRDDVPPDDGWLSPRERATLARLRVPKRREDWRLGRWTAKAAVAAWLGAEPARVEVLAAPEGAPEAWRDGRPAGVSLSLSHRAGRALVVVGAPPTTVGCDLELIEPRSGAFVRDWLAPREQALVAAAAPAHRDRVANLAWTAKEAAAKVRREGLRLDVRDAVMRLGGSPGADGWRPLSVRWADGAGATAAWWRADADWVMVVAAEPAAPPPQRL
jgi:4'-phosphopantetheinyl transferase